MSRKSGIPVYQTLYAFAFVAFVATFSAVMFSSVLMWKTDRTSQARHPLMQTNDSPVTLFLNSSLRRDGSEPASERPPARRVRGALQAITASNNISHRPRKRTFQGPCSRDASKSSTGCVRYGTAYGGYDLPSNLDWLTAGDIMYSFGCGEDISFDLGMVSTFGIVDRLFDPTPNAMAHFQAIISTMKSREHPAYVIGDTSKYSFKGQVREISGKADAKAYFRQVLDSSIDSDNEIGFYPLGLSTIDGNMSFKPPKSGVSHTLEERGTGNSSFRIEVKSLESIMTMFGDAKVSVLKIDIEGHEVKVIPQLLEFFGTKEKHLWPRLMLFDMDSLRKEHTKYDPAGGKRCIKLLESVGYELFTDRNYDYTFFLPL